MISSERLILLGSAGIRDKAKIKKQSLKLVAKTGKAATSLLPKRMQSSVKGKFYGAIGSELYTVPGMEETFKKVVSQDVQLLATKISIPTLLIYGEEDEATPVEYGEILNAKIVGSKLKIVEGAGHFVHLDQPEQVNKLIKEFLQ
jgi:pimeloyl-ACP methyl ester carboxylesterase